MQEPLYRFGRVPEIIYRYFWTAGYPGSLLILFHLLLDLTILSNDSVESDTVFPEFGVTPDTLSLFLEP